MNRHIIPNITIFILLVLGIFSLAFRGDVAPAASAAGPVILNDKQGEYPLGLHMEILEDPTRELTIREVSSPAYDDKFFASPSEVPVFGFTDSAYWVRFQVINETLKSHDWLIDVAFPNMQYVDLYTPLPNGEGFAVKQGGALDLQRHGIYAIPVRSSRIRFLPGNKTLSTCASRPGLP